MRAGAQGDHGLAWRQVLGLGENIFPLVVHSLLLSRLLPARAWHPWGPGPASYFSPGEHRNSLWGPWLPQESFWLLYKRAGSRDSHPSPPRSEELGLRAIQFKISGMPCGPLSPVVGWSCAL